MQVNHCVHVQRLDLLIKKTRQRFNSNLVVNKYFVQIYFYVQDSIAVIKFLVTCCIELDTCNNLVAFLVE